MNRVHPRALVVDDDADLREAIVDILGGLGFEVDAAPDGPEALALLRRSHAVPDLILIDWAMPKMNGDVVRAELKKDPKLAAIPVVLVSSHARDGTTIEFDGFLPKPVDLYGLLSTVESFVRRQLVGAQLEALRGASTAVGDLDFDR